ncbi:MAG TPA: thioredoxin [Candidatus Onthocola stercoravium]|nr:thioredoxin [Candidatus Onthocola stercoravium]
MVKHLENKEQFFEIISNKVLVDFYADWCGPCKMLAPILENIDSVDILKVNVDSFPDLAAKYGVMSIPTLILFENGKELKKEIGFKNLDEIKKMIEE